MAWLEAGLIAAVAAVAEPGPPTGSPAAAPDPHAYVTPAQLFDLADRALAAGNVRLGERALGALASNPNIHVRNEARFRLALRYAGAGRSRDAALLLRQLLDELPNAAAARLQLAALLHKLGDQDAALRELRALRSTDLPVNVARFVDRLSASLQASKPLGLQLEVAVAPDSNINRATRSDTLGTVFGDFTIDQKKKSGLGAAFRGLAQARRPISGDLNLVTRASGEANIYRDKAFNDIMLDLAVGPEFRVGRTRLSAEAGLSQHWFGMKPYQRSFRLAASLVRPLDGVSQLRVDLAARRTDNRVNDLQDGRGFSLRARYERALSPQMLIAASIGADRFKARDDAYSTRSWHAGLTAYRDVGRMTFNAGVELGRLQADERLALFPEARKDRLTRVQFGAVHRQLTFAGFAPITRLVIERNRSSVEFYDFKRTRTEIGVSRAF